MNIEKLSPEFVKDLIPFLASLGGLPKTATVKYGATTFDYTPLSDILAKIKENKKFAFMQPLGSDENGAYIQCVLVHESGESITSDKFPLGLKDGAKMQDWGASITYLKRYTAAAFLGIAADEDNDGQTPEMASPKEYCESCKKVIQGSHGLSPQKIIAGSMKSYGKKLCFDCAMKAKEAKDAEGK